MNHSIELISKLTLRLGDSNEEERIQAAKDLANLVTTQTRELSKEAFDDFIEHVHSTVLRLINSQVPSEILGGLSALDALVDVEYHESGGRKFTKLSTFLKLCIGRNHTDVSVMVKATSVLGRLITITQDGTIAVDVVEFEINRSLEWLNEPRHEHRRHMAVLVLKNLARSAPTTFFIHVQIFLDSVWFALKDQNQQTREAAAEALQATLALIADRFNTQNDKSNKQDLWYQNVLDECSKIFKTNNVDFVHGGLLALGELLRVSGPFIQTKFLDCCDKILKYKDHRDRLLRRTVITLLPRLASANAESFVTSHRHTCINHLLSSMKRDGERNVSFIAIGEMSLALRKNINPYLEPIMGMLRSGLSNRKGHIEALSCISMLSRAVGPFLEPYIGDTLASMFDTGLSPALTQSLSDLVTNIPSFLPKIQERLLNLISMVLSNKPYYHPGTPLSLRKKAPNPALSGNYETNTKKIAHALHTLGTFDFSSHVLTELVCDCVVSYLDHELPIVRKEAAITCTKLIIPSGEEPPTRGHAASVVAEVLEKLLNVGIADPDPSIRKTVLLALEPKFDHFLAQPENLRCLFLALNDEVFEIRELTVTILGRQTKRNPAYILPSLRTTLIQILTELEFSRDNVNKEESARLLSLLVKASHSLVEPYVEPILNALFPKLRDANPRVASCALAALGELVQVGQQGIAQYNEKLLPPIIETLQDQSSSTKREVALRTLGQLVKSTGFVITPFITYPHLLDILLNEIKTENVPGIRRQVLSVLGTIGAIDPYKHRLTQLKRGQNPNDNSVLTFGGSDDALDKISPSSEEYYPTVAITKMLRILKDPTLSTHHTAVVQAVISNIFKSLGLKCVPFLPEIVPPLLHIMRNCETNFRKFLFQQLAVLVSITKQHIRTYLKDIYQLIQEYWQAPYFVAIISLVEEISAALKDEFKSNLQDLLPQILDIVNFPITQDNAEVTIKVLQALEGFGTQLTDYIHMVLPAIVRIFESTNTPPYIRRIAINILGKLSNKLTFSDYSSRIIHPLVRVLNEANSDLRDPVMETLCSLVYQFGADYRTFIPMVRKVTTKHHISYPRYESLEYKIANHQPLVPEDAFDNSNDSSLAENIDISPAKKIKINEENLKKVWDSTNLSTKNDWNEWLRKFLVELLKESPYPALRSCKNLAQAYHPLARELFNASFYSCWNELSDAYQDDLVHHLEIALKSVLPKILQALLNLAEFMEHDDKPLPISGNTLGELAIKCNALAKALRYKETEFRDNPQSTIDSLIGIYNELQQYDAASGILEYAQIHHNITFNETQSVVWYEKLQRWKLALSTYEKQSKEDPANIDAALGRIRCVYALGQWESLSTISKEVWATQSQKTRAKIAPLAATAAWNLGDWNYLEELVGYIDPLQVNHPFYRAVLAIYKDNYEEAFIYLNKTRDIVDASITALVSESYNRAYEEVVTLQLISELEEVIEYKQLEENSPRRKIIKENWKTRLYESQPNVDVWRQMLSVRSMVLSPRENIDMWLKFSSLCRKSGRFSIAQKVFQTIAPEIEQFNFHGVPPKATYNYLKYIWDTDNKVDSLEHLKKFAESLDDSDSALLARCYLKLGQWQLALSGGVKKSEIIPEVMSNFKASTRFDKHWYKAWHAWALTNFSVLSHLRTQSAPFSKIREYIFSAVHGFFRSISLAPEGQSLQDTLRILNLWFNYGAYRDVQVSLNDGFNTVSIDNWLQVIPQIIARIHTQVKPVRRMIHDLLVRLGRDHPQALLYSLTVASKSQSKSRRSAALAVIDSLRQHSPLLVEQSQIVAQELIRVAILWPEMWHEGLEEASRQYFGDSNVDGMFETLAPLHEMLNSGPETLQEISFQQQYGKDLQEAAEFCRRYRHTKQQADLDHAWELYYHVFRRINKQLNQLTQLELSQISPKLEKEARDLAIAVPGTYKLHDQLVCIKSFVPNITVITSKQRPRKISTFGNDGKEYLYLLKGHEDLRQDERVMQLFSLVNTLLESNLETAKRNLSIQRYSVCPLSPNSGLIGWVPNHDTLHALIRDYRDSRKIVLNIEHRLMMQMAADYDNLQIIQKVEVFEHALHCTPGMDLDRILWLKSKNSEMWLDRRTNYTRSLAVMSMVGYILGLGDRHPSNLMMNRYTGKILHIDFGDCFEVAMMREKFPEKIPFRLTRMLVNAMEVSGIEGTFRSTCQSVMKVMRENKESLMAVLEAFVYDPLLNWRLLTTSPDLTDLNTLEPSGSSLGRTRKIQTEEMSEDDLPEVLNHKAVEVVDRVSNKLTGSDFGNDPPLTVEKQVQKLIEQASDHENLSQCYIGWCPFW